MNRVFLAPPRSGLLRAATLSVGLPPLPGSRGSRHAGSQPSVHGVRYVVWPWQRCCSAASAHRLPLGLSPGSGTRSSGLSYKSPVRTSRCSTRGRGTPAESTSRRADTSTSIAVRCVGRIGLKTLAFSGSRARGDFSPRLNHHHPKTTTPGLPRRRTRTIRPFVVAACGGRTFETERERLFSLWKEEDTKEQFSSLSFVVVGEKSLKETVSPQKCFSLFF